MLDNRLKYEHTWQPHGKHLPNNTWPKYYTSVYVIAFPSVQRSGNHVRKRLMATCTQIFTSVWDIREDVLGSREEYMHLHVGSHDWSLSEHTNINRLQNVGAVYQ